ncbi:hypothetical protein BY458DRAFT_584246 [Sporodiniella umbellata]|nr:hypothetical protein BY458DRAFT_584246 [Sporodiniella umbellata]
MNEMTMDKSKVKAVGRISRLFQKKPKAKSSVPSSASTLSISDPVLSKQSSFQSISSVHLSLVEPLQREASFETKFLPSLPMSRDIDNGSTMTIETETTETRQQLIEQQRNLLRELESEKCSYEHDNERLEEQLRLAQDKIKKRTDDMLQLKDSFQSHLRSTRCTDDSPQSIGEQLLSIRKDIEHLAGVLLPFAEPEITLTKLSTLWLNLKDSIERLGPERIQILTEKFIMDVLVQNLNTNHFPGLSCPEAFLEVQDWLDQHDASPLFTTQLRQEVSMIISQKTGEIEERWNKSAERCWHHLYRGLQKSFPKSFLVSQEDALAKETYCQQLRGLVKKVMDLGSAIKGQEVCITAMGVKEGVQPFDPAIMEDQDGQTVGIIALCISPPFVVKLSDRYEPLVKGRVLCFLPNTADDA